MATQTTDEMMMDMQAGTVRTLEAICRQLIDSKAINAELLLADLVQAQVDLAARGVGLHGAAPSLLYAALGGKSPKIDP